MSFVNASLESLFTGIVFSCDKFHKILQVNSTGKQHFCDVDWHTPIFLHQLLRSPKMRLSAFFAQTEQEDIIVFDKSEKPQAFTLLKTDKDAEGSFYVLLRFVRKSAKNNPTELTKALKLFADYSNSCIIVVDEL